MVGLGDVYFVLIVIIMDCEKLISSVQEHVPLWDMRDRCYHRRDIQRKLWTRVAEEMGATGKLPVNEF